MNRILQQIARLPTAPYREHAVIGYIHEFCERNRLSCEEDRFGNLLVTARAGKQRWVLVAHMDHPGFEAVEFLRDGVLRAAFRGYVLATHMRQTPVVFFTGNQEIRGTIVRAMAGERGEAKEVHVRVSHYVAPGSLGMFDLAVAAEKRNQFHSRAIDDLGGVAVALQTLVNARRSRRGPGVAALFTRAEEDGFIGAIAAARFPALLRKTDLIVSIECSAAQPYARLGKGAIIRVGDRTSVFDSAMTYHLGLVADGLAKKDSKFQFQRALMPGGTCEATAFGVYGRRACAVCIPLGNYHNMVPGKRQIAAEYIDLRDWESLVKLLTAAVATSPEDSFATLRRRLDERYKANSALLR